MVSVKGFGKPMMDYDLVKYEFDFGFQFPTEYKKFLKVSNGGIPDLKKFDLEGKVQEGLSIDFFLGINVEKEKNVFYILKITRGLIPKGLVPFALTEGAGVLFIGVGDESFEKIYYWERGDIEKPSQAVEGENLFPVASNFEEFLNSIY